MGTHAARSGLRRYSVAFTLLELMTTVFIITIFAAIAIPSFTHYTLVSQRSSAESMMNCLAGELDRARARGLSYEGFVPSTCINGYETTTGTYAQKSVLIPKGSNESTFTYRILIMDGACRTSLNITTSGCAGSTWVMIARPNTTVDSDSGTPSGYMASASRLVLDNQGVRCMTSGTITDSIPDSFIAFGAAPIATNTDALLCKYNLNQSVPWR